MSCNDLSRSRDSWHSAIIQLDPRQIDEDLNVIVEHNSEEYVPPINATTPWIRHWRYFSYLTIIKIGVYILDVFSDIMLGVEYLKKRQYLFSGLTFIFIWFPAMFITYMSKRRRKNLPLNRMTNILKCTLLVAFSFEPVICYVIHIKSMLRERIVNPNDNSENRKKEFKKSMKNQNRELTALRIYEGCLEAIPQLIIQLSIIRRYDDFQFDFTMIVQIISIITSLCGLVFSVIMWINARRKKLTVFGLFLWSSGRLITITSRLLAISGSAVIHPGYTTLGLSIHWLIMTLWHRYKYRQVMQDVVVSSAVGLINTFLPCIDSVQRTMISQALLLTEDLTMITIWAILADENIKNGHTFIPLINANIIVCFVGAAYSTLYAVPLEVREHYLVEHSYSNT